MPGSADSLQAARDRGRRFNLDDQIDGAHVDAELQRRGRDECFDPPGFQQVFDLAARRARQRAMMRTDQRFACQLVQRACQPLRKAAAVDEDAASTGGHESGRASGGRSSSKSTARTFGPLDRRPARQRRRPGPERLERPTLRSRHIFDRHFDAQLELLPVGGVHDRDRAIGRSLVVASEFLVELGLDFFDCVASRRRRLRGRVRHRAAVRRRGAFGATEKTRDFVERPLCCRESDSLDAVGPFRAAPRVAPATARGARRACPGRARESRR